MAHWNSPISMITSSIPRTAAMYCVWLATACALLTLNCENGVSQQNSDDTDAEYVIKHNPCSFNVVNIHTNNSICVFAVVQRDSSIYSRVHSHPPAFRDKVVEGTIVPDSNYTIVPEPNSTVDVVDTVFRITQHVRDTSGIW